MFEPRFSITLGMMKDVAAIEAAREMIGNAPLVPAWERQFQQEAAMRQVFHSTHIEGNELSFTQASLVFQQGEEANVLARDRDIQEIINYRNVINYINSSQIDVVDELLLLNLHEMVVEGLLAREQSGSYRRQKVSIVSNKTKQAVFTPPEQDQVPGLMEALFGWLEEQRGSRVLPAPLVAGILHYELVRIHPFVDGNGRTARLMALLWLYAEGYDMKQFFCLDEHYDRDAASYYAALQSANESGDLTGWLEYFIHGIAVEFSQVKQRVIELSRDHALKSKLGQIRVNDRQVKLITYMEQQGTVANAEWKELFPGVSDDTILRDVKDLMDKKIVKKRGKTKAAYYTLA